MPCRNRVYEPQKINCPVIYLLIGTANWPGTLCVGGYPIQKLRKLVVQKDSFEKDITSLSHYRRLNTDASKKWIVIENISCWKYDDDDTPNEKTRSEKQTRYLKEDRYKKKKKNIISPTRYTTERKHKVILRWFHFW